MNSLNEVLADIDAKAKSIPQLPELAEKAKVRPAYLVIGAVAVIAFLLMLILGFIVIVNTVCFAYPAYAALVAMQSKPSGYDEQWLTYFILYGTFHVMESLYTSVLEDWPFTYPFLKLLFFVWCFLPSTTGAAKLYNIAIKKMVKVAKSE